MTYLNSCSIPKSGEVKLQSTFYFNTSLRLSSEEFIIKRITQTFQMLLLLLILKLILVLVDPLFLEPKSVDILLEMNAFFKIIKRETKICPY